MLTDRVAGFYLMIFNESILCEMTQCQGRMERVFLEEGPPYSGVVLEKILESPLASKEIKPVNRKGNQP